jgi:hypothetical protein
MTLILGHIYSLEMKIEIGFKKTFNLKEKTRVINNNKAEL